MRRGSKKKLFDPGLGLKGFPFMIEPPWLHLDMCSNGSLDSESCQGINLFTKRTMSESLSLNGSGGNKLLASSAVFCVVKRI